MSQKPLFFIQFVLVVALLTMHAFAIVNDWYWHYLWLDIPMHFLGGLWAALAVVWGLRFLGVRTSFVHVFAGVIAISIVWEIFEYLAGFQREGNYVFDTMLDLVMDIIGGMCGFLFMGKSLRTRAVLQSDSNGTPQNDPS